VAEAYSAPKGTVDLVGQNARLWDFCVDVAREVFERAGYRSIYTPVFESTVVFTRGIGESTDVVGKEMYTFIDKGGRSLTLRPENTAGVVRCAIHESLTANGAVAKLFYFGPQYRYERPQKGRQRQFYQIGVELLGLDTPASDAEVIRLLWDYFIALGIPADSMRLLINSMGCTDCRPTYRELLKVFIDQHRSGLCDECVRRASTNPLRALDCKNESCRQVFSNAPRLRDALCADCAEHDRAVRALLDLIKITYHQDDALVRGLDYYTRTVFEIQTDVGLGSQNALGGGGRYDGLFEALGGKPTPGIGFALGFERTALALGAAGIVLPEEGACDVYVVSATDDLRTKAFKLTDDLRARGWYTQSDLAGRSLKSQMKSADHAHALYTAILAPDEDGRDGLVLRNMETKEERFVTYEGLFDTLMHLDDTGVETSC